MKKNYLMLGSALLLAASMTAQQLPNADFEGGWVDCVPWTSNSNMKTHGKTPNSWTISHVIGTSTLGKTEVGENVTGYDGTGSAPRVYVNETMSKAVPGYITLGTTWSTAKGTSGSNADGGTFGGINFTYRPDAVSFVYQRSHGTANAAEQATVVAYLWKGTYTQDSVPGNIAVFGYPKSVSMTDRDRNILEMSTLQGGAVSSTAGAEKIAQINYAITGDASSWTSKVIEFDYATESTPEKFNIIFCAGDYFSSSPGVGNSLTIDNVKLLYYSQLSGVSIGGTAVADFNPNTYNYTVDELSKDVADYATELYGQGKSASVVVTIDEANVQATIVVTNANGVDADGLSSHTYVIKGNKFAETTTPPVPDFPDGTSIYSGTLVIDMMGEIINPDDNSEYKVYITPTGANTCIFSLPNFILDIGEGPTNLGDIVVENSTFTTNADGTISYSGTKSGLELAGGEIIADVEMSGTETAIGELSMTINVVWSGIPILVTFNGKKTGTTGVEFTPVDNVNAPIEYYNLQGVRVANPENGIFIKRQGSNVSKVIL